MIEKYKIKTVIDRQWSGLKKGWVDVQSITNEEMEHFFSSQIYIDFILKNKEKPSKINPQLTYQHVENIFRKKEYNLSELEFKKIVNFVAFKQFLKAYKHLIEVEK